jgi:hypothetical protein
MQNILEFDNARMPLHLLWLRGAGLPDPTRWRVEGRPNQRYEDGVLSGCPQLVALNRLGSLCVIRFMAGASAAELSDDCLTQCALDAALVRKSLMRRGQSVAQITLWWAFDDGAHATRSLPLIACSALLQQAHRLAREGGMLAVSTAIIAPLLSCRTAH